MFNLSEAREAIKDKPEFNCNLREFGFAIDYNVEFESTFVGRNGRENMILQNLRGTLFDKDGNIIRLAYHKFRNINQSAEYSAKNFDLNEPHIIQEKLDGSMISPVFVGHGFRLATRAGVTEVAEKAESFMEEMKSKNIGKFLAYDRLVRDCHDLGMTPIFEFCSRAQKIVLDYPEPKLVLTGIRRINDGTYLSIDQMLRLAHDMVDVVEHVEVEPNTSITDLADIIKNWVGKEGVVVKFADGRMVKIKGEDYCLKHRALDGLRFEKDVLKLVLENKIDDVLPLVTDEVRARLVAYNESVLRSIVNHNKSMYAQYQHILERTTSRAEFAKVALNSPYKAGLFKLFENKPYTLVELALTKCGSSTDVESIRWLIGPSYLSF